MTHLELMMPRSVYPRSLLIFFAGAAASLYWSHLQHPIRPLYVDLYNGTASTLHEVIIEHGKVDLQERIQVFQLQPGEHRLIVLNHAPGKGFNVSTTLNNGQELSICAGKERASLVRATITSQGILPMPVH